MGRGVRHSGDEVKRPVSGEGQVMASAVSVVLLGAALTSLAGRGLAIPDPCTKGNYIELSERKRVTGYTLKSNEQALCDVSLTSGWYRFTGAQNARLTTECPQKGQCGTTVGIWMNSSHPSPTDGMVSRRACANFGAVSGRASHCCDHSIAIGVKNCGAFYVYYLHPVPSCAVAYCAETDVPMVINSPVVSGPDSNGQSFRFTCNVDYPRLLTGQALEVKWTLDGRDMPGVPHMMLTGDTRQVHLPGLALAGHLGKTVGCSVRGRSLKANTTGPWLDTKQGYWAGIKASPGHVTLGGVVDTTNVTLTSTIPIVCHNPGVNAKDCCLHLVMDFDGGHDNVVTPHTCSPTLCPKDWNPATHTASVILPLTAVKDHSVSEDKPMNLTFRPVKADHGGPYLSVFDKYTVPPSPMTVKPTKGKHCVWTGDPHIRSMESSGHFSLFKVGDYTMYESTTRHLEIQARTWPCGFRGRATCICGVAIRERNDLIRISQCDQAYNRRRTKPIVQVASHPLQPGTSVQRSSDGKHIAVYLESGTEVKIDANSRFFNVFLAMPGKDQGSGRGICGTFDLNPHNEFTHRDGSVSRPCSGTARFCIPYHFTESWRNNRTRSLFETVPPRVPEPVASVSGYCSCNRNRNLSLTANCSSASNLSTPTNLLQCPNCRPVSSPLSTFIPLGQGGTGKRRATLYVDEDTPDVRFDPDQPHDFQASSVVWPTPSGITAADARARCQQALNSSQLWAGCQSFPHLSDLNMKDCVLDIQLSDGYNFLEAAVSAFLTECQVKLAENPANYVTDSSGRKVLKASISSDVCSVFCSRHGRCVRGKCVCSSGYAGDNCDLVAGKGPQLLPVRGNGTCDVTQRPCRKIFLDVDNIAVTETLFCAVTTHFANPTKASDITVLKGEFLSSTRVSCPLPDTHGAAKTSFRVRVSGDADTYSNWESVTVYDASCLHCPLHRHCSQLAGTCLINNICHQDGDVNARDDTKVCDVSSNSTHWTTKGSPAQFPAIQTPLLSGPDSDFLLTCAVNTSASARPDARVRVTWLSNTTVMRQDILGPGDSKSLFSVRQMPQMDGNSSKVTCAVESFYAGQSGHSQQLVSNVIVFY